ncbi:MAG TPA: protein kinase [Pyrinomonadaceae bacterium]|jgi:serine/threonine protein kinase
MMKTIGDFKLVRELGRGGMGVVYEAIEKKLERKVAVKVLHPEVADREDIAQRFIDEGRKLAMLSHPSIVRVYRFDCAKGLYYLVVEYIEGLPLDNVLARERLPLAKTVAVLRTVASALGHAHEKGIVHRDVKPGNIFLCPGGRVVLSDFGIAKDLNPGALSMTSTGDVFGTPAYMSPEQAEGAKDIPCAADVYALGVLAFEMVTGRVPFSDPSPYKILTKHINEPPPPIVDIAPGVPRTLAALIERMLAKDPARRPQNGTELEAELAACEQELRGERGGPTKGRAPARPSAHADESLLVELEVTVACFKLVDFSVDLCQRLLPGRVAFLLESWYRLVRRSVYERGGVVDRYVGGKVTTLFGYPQRHADHVQRAVEAAVAVNEALAAFNRAHDLQLCMNAGIACGPALVGRIVGDCAQTSVLGDLMREMMVMARAKDAAGCIRLNRAAYRRVSTLGDFKRCEIVNVPEAWLFTPLVKVRGRRSRPAPAQPTTRRPAARPSASPTTRKRKS